MTAPGGQVAASDLAFLFGASQELPLLLIPGSVATACCSHWSLIGTRKHYPSDVIGGGVIAVLVTAAAGKLRPPPTSTQERTHERPIRPD